MDPKFQTSFIPKKTDSAGVSNSVGASAPVSIFSVIATIIFIIAIVVSVALFGYKQILNSQIAQADSSLVSAREAFQPDTIKELTDVSAMITTAQTLLNQHVATSQIFDALQNLTLKKISFSNFDFSDKDGAVSVTMDTEAQSYNAMAQQSAVFSNATFIQNPSFSSFDVAQNGDITAKFSADIDPSLISYKNLLSSANANQ